MEIPNLSSLLTFETSKGHLWPLTFEKTFEKQKVIFRVTQPGDSKSGIAFDIRGFLRSPIAFKADRKPLKQSCLRILVLKINI